MILDNTRKNLRAILFIFSIIATTLLLNSCGLFDKDLKQDKHIAAFRHQMLVTLDSLKTPEDRIKNFDSIVYKINNDEALITERKKNMVLIECYSFISNEYCKLGRFNKAIEICNTSLAIDSTEAGAFFNRGVAYQGSGNNEKAIYDYNKAIKINSNYTDAYYNRGLLYENIQELDKAIDDYSKAIKQNPSYLSEIYLNRGNVYQGLKEMDKALDDYNQTLELDSVDIAAYSNRGNVYTELGEYDLAIADYTQAISLDSLNADPYNKRAFVYELKREFDKAEEDYKEAIRLDPYNKVGAHDMAKSALDRLKISKRVLKEIHHKKKN